MKTLKLITLAAFTVLFSQCKTTAPTAPSGSAPSMVEVVNILDSARSMFLDAAAASGGDPYKALYQTAGYLSSFPGVQFVYPADSTYIHIILKSGLKAEFRIDEQDSAGYSIFKGGGGHEKTNPILRNLKSDSRRGGLSKNTITNKKVLYFSSANKSMKFSAIQTENSKDRMDTSGLGLELTVLRDEQCTYDVVESFPDYGLVIISGHGDPEGFFAGSTIRLDAGSNRTEEGLKTLINTQLHDGAYDKLMEGNLELVYPEEVNLDDPNWIKKYTKKDPLLVKILITSKYLEHLPEMPNTVIFGNMCFSGWMSNLRYIPREEIKEKDGTTVIIKETTLVIDPIGKAFTQKNPISYYGFSLNDPPGTSRAVLDVYAAKMEDSLLKALITVKDSTGIANRSSIDKSEFFEPPSLKLPGEGILFLRQYGAEDYSYEKCGDSIIDERDGQKYATACIGGQRWMAQNLNYALPGSACYDDDGLNCNIFGRLYDWNMVMAGSAATDANPSKVQGICPKGWHVPSVSEWFQLGSYADAAAAGNNGGDALRDSVLWQNTQYPGKDKFGFKGLPGGKYVAQPGLYRGIYLQGYWWTASIDSVPNYLVAGLDPLSTHLTSNYAGFSKDDKLSCRCVKDNQ